MLRSICFMVFIFCSFAYSFAVFHDVNSIFHVINHFVGNRTHSYTQHSIYSNMGRNSQIENKARRMFVL